MKCEKCNSEKNHFIRWQKANGSFFLRKQCQSCGFIPSINYKSSLANNFNDLPISTPEDRNKILLEEIEDFELKKPFREIFNSYAQDHFKRRLNYYKNVYLKSDEWKHKRQLIMDFYNNTCQKCGDKATDTHHIRYDNMFCENFEDLIPLCRSCHSKEHDNGLGSFLWS